jgi:hypothetical protein
MIHYFFDSDFDIALNIRRLREGNQGFRHFPFDLCRICELKTKEASKWPVSAGSMDFIFTFARSA